MRASLTLASLSLVACSGYPPPRDPVGGATGADARLTDGAGTPPNPADCPAVTEADVVAAGGGALPGGSSDPWQTCSTTSTCTYGNHTCSCQGPLGGAPREPWWACHQARAKADGCPDDDALVAGAACSSDGQRCDAPGVCGCSHETSLTCTGGVWTAPACGPCMAP